MACRCVAQRSVQPHTALHIPRLAAASVGCREFAQRARKPATAHRRQRRKPRDAARGGLAIPTAAGSAPRSQPVEQPVEQPLPSPSEVIAHARATLTRIGDGIRAMEGTSNPELRVVVDDDTGSIQLDLGVCKVTGLQAACTYILEYDRASERLEVPVAPPAQCLPPAARPCAQQWV